MGCIVTSVSLKNVIEPDKSIRFDAFVDAGATYLVLPEAWEYRLEKFESTREVKLQTASQQTVSGKLCGPVKYLDLK